MRKQHQKPTNHPPLLNVMYTSQEKHLKSIYIAADLLICEVSYLCMQKHCVLFLCPFFLKKDFLFRQYSQMQKIFRILIHKSNNFSFEGNVCNCEILRPNNPCRCMILYQECLYSLERLCLTNKNQQRAHRQQMQAMFR